jgi:hypothetical protein
VKGDWCTLLGEVLVRWFPSEWNLKERKERERFQAVLQNLPEDLTLDKLIRNGQPTEFLNSLGFKSFKLVKTVNGKRKLIGYFESWQALQARICNPTIWGEDKLDWQRHFPPTPKGR